VAKNEAKSLTGRGSWDGQSLLLAMPQTYMNNSGEAVRALIDYYRIALPDLLIVYDDLDLPPGRLRMRAKGSAGGHNGMRSIINYMGAECFARLRIGIGSVPEKMDGADYVLSQFLPEESSLVTKACTDAIEACLVWASFGVDKGMAHVNTKLSETP
jgi:PTH1 family peptidyl-tRNA hydrolase